MIQSRTRRSTGLEGKTRGDGRRRTVLAPLLGVVALGVGMLAFTAPSGADSAAVSGGAFGESVSVSFASGQQVTSGPLPSVTLSAPGGSVSDAAQSVAVGTPNGLAPFGGALLSTGALAVRSQGSTGSSASSSSSSSLDDVKALGATLTAAGASSTCTSATDGSSGATTLTGAKLVLSGTETVALPAAPAPGTRFEGTGPAPGDTYAVILNQQEVGAGSVTVTAVHIVLNGPTAVGDIVLAQTRCATTSPGLTAPPTTVVSTTPSTTPTTAAPTTPTTVAPTTPTTAAMSTTPAATSVATSTSEPPPAASVTGDEVKAAVAGPQLPAAAAFNVAKVGGGAFGYQASVGFFGGPPSVKGPDPSVTLPESGVSPASTKTLATGLVKYGPAELLTSDRVDVSTQGTVGPGGSVTSSAKIANANRGGAETLSATSVSSTCTIDEAGKTASVKVVGGRLLTSEGTDFSSPADDTVVPLPASPAPNTSFEGKLESLGDSFRVVLNEQVVTGDAITVNAFHTYLLGPTAVGDIIGGQSRCSLTAAAAQVTTTTTTAPNASTTTVPGSSTTTVPGSTAANAARAAKVAASSTSRGASASGTKSAAQALAHTGATAPLLPALALLTAALAASRWARPRRATSGGSVSDDRA